MKRIATAFASLFFLVTANSASADTMGEPGKIAGIEIVGAASTDQGLQDGSLLVDHGGDTLARYLWGGSWCPGKDLSDNQMAMLLDLARTPKLTILPYWRMGNAGTRCLTSFMVTPKKGYVDAIAK